MWEKLNIKNWNVGTKLTSAFVIIILIGLGVTGYLSFKEASTALNKKAKQELTAVRELKKERLQNYFKSAQEDVKVLSELPVVTDNLNPFTEAYQSGVNSQEYQNLYEEVDNQLEFYEKNYGYYDLFLINNAGNIVYSVEQEADFGTNLETGPYQDSALAKAYRQGKKKATLTDFQQYEPSGEPASFIAAPVKNENNQVLGVVALQIPINEINEFMTMDVGMGESGESYIIGSDYLMRSDSRFTEQGTILKRKIKTEMAEKAVNGQTGVEIGENHEENEVLSAYTPIDIQGQHWAMLVEMDEDEILAAADKLKWEVIIIVVISVIVAVILGTLLIRGLVVNPVKRVQDVLASVANNDFSNKVEVTSNDELGQMANDLNETIDKLSNVLQQVKQAALNVTNGASEISEGNQDLSQRTQEQSSSLEEVSATIEEINSSIKEIAESSEEADDVADETMEAVNEGAEVVDETMDSMEEMTESSEKIAEIITTVNDIAFQTNLLALNAAVEAARAGEHGKGFAVVAAEVRNLASQAADSAEEIEDLITEIIDQIEEGNELVAETGEALEEIIKNSRQVSQEVSEVASAMEEQSSATNQMQGAVEELDQTTQQNASMVEEIASASESLNSEAKEMAEVVRQFKLNNQDTRGQLRAQQNKLQQQSQQTQQQQNQQSQQEDKQQTNGGQEQGLNDLEDSMEQNFNEDDFEKF